MKFLFSFFIFLCVSIHPISAQTYVLIKGYITSTSDYCNGARPSEEVLADLATEKPLANKLIYIKVGSINKSTNKLVKKVKTDEYGRFQVFLKSGVSYYFVEEWKGKVFVSPRNTKDLKWDISCLRKRYTSPDFVIKVQPNNNPEVIINYHQPCFYAPYCGNYTGPLPP